MRHAVTELRSTGVSIDALYSELFAPSLNRVGELWAAGAISVAEEHVASALVEQLMAALYPEVFAAPRGSRERVLVALPEGERHVIGLRMVSDILEGHGFDVVFLGADTPGDELAHALRQHKPQVAVLAAYTPESAAALQAAASRLLELSPRLSIIAGGAADPIRQVVNPGERIAIVDTIAQALPTVERMVARMEPPAQAT